MRTSTNYERDYNKNIDFTKKFFIKLPGSKNLKKLLSDDGSCNNIEANKTFEYSMMSMNIPKRQIVNPRDSLKMTTINSERANEIKRIHKRRKQEFK